MNALNIVEKVIAERDREPKAPPPISFFAPELRDIGERDLIYTPKGIVIGSAWTRKPEPQSADADLLQRALLADPTEPHVRAMVETPRRAHRDNRSHRIVDWLLFALLAICCGVVALDLAGLVSWMPGGLP